MREFDVVVIGAGLMGSFTARHLAVRGYSVAVLERENDVSMGISRSNTAIVYAGYDMKPGTLKAQLTVNGNAAFADLCSELGVDFERTGSLMLASGPRGLAVLQDKLEQGLKSGVPGLRLLDAAELRSLEPGVTADAIAALYAPTTATVNPWQLCLAAARDALRHGASFFLEHEVVAIDPGFTVSCANGSSFSSPVVINCSGIDADLVSELVAPVSFRLSLSNGSYMMLDGAQGGTQGDGGFVSHLKTLSPCVLSPCVPPCGPRHIVFSEPETRGKGATFVPTTDGALLLGPSEEDSSQADREPGYPTEPGGLDFVRSQSLAVFPDLPLEQTFRSFGTLRPSIHWAHLEEDGNVSISDDSIHDFYIAWAKDCPGFLNVAGIKTPGLTCADGIGAFVADLVDEYLSETGGTGLGVPHFCGTPSPVPPVPSPVPLVPSPVPSVPPSPVPDLEASPSNSEILCRCRQVTYGEARAAIHAQLGARTVDGLKRRVGCGLGRCQGGFCMERVVLLLAEELPCDPSEIDKDRCGSWIIKAPREGTHEDGGFVTHRDTKPPSDCIPPNPRLLVIGGGAAGLAAACATHEAGIRADDILLVDRLDKLGGILPQCSHHGYGNREYGGELSGMEFLAPILKEFSERSLDTLLNTMVTSITPQHAVSLAGPAGHCTIEPEAIIFASGCRERPLGALPVAGTRPSGIFTAGAAQRMVNLQGWDIGEHIVILGSGDVGMVMAETLTQRGKEVLALIEQETLATGLAANYKRYVHANDIPLIASSTITKVFGYRRIEGVEIKTEGGSSFTMQCDTLIVSVGLIPETDLLREVMGVNPSAPPPWIFLAGNARRVHSYIEGVVADGTSAGIQAAAYLS